MVEVVINIPCPRMSKKLLKELREDISKTVRLRLAREMLLREWDAKLSKSNLSEADSLRMGREANKAALNVWKRKGVL